MAALRNTIVPLAETKDWPLWRRPVGLLILLAAGMPLAFANISADLAEAISARNSGRAMDPAADLYPRAEDGLRSMAAVYAVAASGKSEGAWLDARPPMFR